MLSVAEAQAVILQCTRPLPPKSIPLTPDALGTVLAEDVVSDVESPPYDKSLMDGYAVRTADLPEGSGTLQIVEEITAGRTPRQIVGAGQASRIMTGAMLPEGADAVIQVERTRSLENDRVEIEGPPIRPGQNILRRASETRRGDIVASARSVLRPQEFGLLAAAGRVKALTHPRPRVAVLSTGDEVVDAPATPGPCQIRNSNGPMLTAQVARAGGVPQYLGIAADRLESLRPLLEEGLRADVLVVSGGVSAGTLDLVPAVLLELGVTQRLHKVHMKPGKPAFVGTRDNVLVFGLPGNPVSAMVCFELFVRPALRRLAGHSDVGPQMVPAVLSQDYKYRTDRPTYHPARLDLGAAGWQVRAAPWFGSPDLRGLTAANAFLLLPEGDHLHRAGEVFPVLRLD